MQCLKNLNLFSGVQPVLGVSWRHIHVTETLLGLSTAAACSQQSLDALPHTQWSGRNTTWSPQADHSRYLKTRNPLYANLVQLRMYSQTFFPSAVRRWNRVPSDTCYLAPDSFKSELSKINLIWSCIKFLSHRTARSYFLKLAFAQHRITQHMTSTRSAI